MSNLYKKRKIYSFLTLLPGIVITMVFIIYPVIRTGILSLQTWNGVANAPRKFVGIANYLSILQSPKFWLAMRNSFFFIVGGFLILMPAAFLMALLVTSKVRGRSFFRTSYLLPVMLGTTAVGLMWTFMLNGQFGIVGWLGRVFGVQNPPNLLASAPLNVWMVVLVNEWMYAGYNMLIFAAGLVAIPEDIHDACRVDGCGGIRKLFLVTVPLCKNMFMVFSVTCITGCLKVFDIVWSMTRGGPMDSSTTPAILLYTEGFQFKLMGRSSAVSIILLAMGLAISLLLSGTVFRQDKNL